MGKLGTIQLMMSPRSELEKAKPSVTASGAPAIHSVFPSVGTVSTSAGFDRLSATVHEVREREKIVAAKMLRRAGHEHLISEGHKKLLNKTSNVSEALEHQRKKSAKASTSFPFNTSSYSATDRLDERSLRRMNKDAGKGKSARALSPPRRIEARSTAYPFKQ
jgi:hypothetical protein